MSQFVTVQVGQCGNQIGSAFWPLVLYEYGIQASNGPINCLKKFKNFEKNNDELHDAFSSFFHVPDNRHTNFKSISNLEEARVTARAVLVDMEDSVVGKFRQGPLKALFNKTCTVTNYPGSGNNWAEGFYSHGRDYQYKIEEAIRLAVEKCDCLHGFLLLHSLGGGTGSGLGTAILKLLSDNYPHVDRFDSCVYPTHSQDVVTAPYNVMLATDKLIDYATCVFPADNRALQDICGNFASGKTPNADQAKYNATCLPFQDMNSIIVNMLLHLTSGSRFSGNLNTDMNELATNLVPYPYQHFIFSSVSPVSLTASHISSKTKYQDDLFSSAWSRNNQLVKIDPLQQNSLVIGAAHIYRGDSTITDLRRNIERFQEKAKFTVWSKEAMKVGLCSVPPVGHPASLLCMINSTAIGSLFKDVIKQFDLLFKKKAHLHHYLQVDGFGNEDFVESKEKVLTVYQEYKKIEKQSPINISRLLLN